MKVIYTVIFGNYEELKEPTVITPGWKYICFTDQKLKSRNWEIKNIQLLPGEDPQRLARFYKIKMFQYWEQSIWVDASFRIDVNLDEWWIKFFNKGLSAPIHPLRNCVYIEGFDCIIAKRGNKEKVEAQIAAYKIEGIPARNGLISSGLLMRENKPEVLELCEKWWQELKKHSARDQIAFAKVSIGYEAFTHFYRWDYRREKDFIYLKHYKNR